MRLIDLLTKPASPEKIAESKRIAYLHNLSIELKFWEPLRKIQAEARAKEKASA